MDGPIFQQVEKWTIVIGERDVVNAVEMGVRFMRHSHAHIYSHSKFALGPGTRIHGEYELPANSNVSYEITVRNILDNTNDENVLLEICQSKKAIANDIVRNEKIREHDFAKQRALQLYKRAITLLESPLQDQSPNGDDASLRPKLTECLLDCRNNIAAVHLSCQQYHEAKEACIEVLKLDPTNEKALLRAAKACIYDPSSSFLEAKAAIQAAEDACGGDSEHMNTIRNLKEDVKRKQASHKRKKQRMVSKMAKGTISSTDTEHSQDIDSSVSRSETTTTNASEANHQTSKTLLIVAVMGILVSILIPMIIPMFGFEQSP